MPREREGIPASDAATHQARRARGLVDSSDELRKSAARARRARGLVDSSDELRKSAARARRAEAAIVSSYLRALRHLGEVPIGAPRPEMPH